jgi:GAF domain-containing protein
MQQVRTVATDPDPQPEPEPDPERGREAGAAVRGMADRSDLVAILRGAVRMCVDAIDACDMAGASVTKSGRTRTLVASDDQLRIFDDLQFQLHEGPCFDALREGHPVTADDLATDHRWPEWGPLIAERTGVHASMSFRLFTSKDVFGALNLYSAKPSGFAHHDVVQGFVLAAHASGALTSQRHVQELTEALETRTVIGQATGILMERFGLDADAAFGVLRRISQTNNIRVARLAADLVEHGWLPRPGG